jgi:hypothetical protein
MPCRTDETGTPIEAVSCGLRLGCPDGEVLYERVHDAISETCRVFMSHGVGAFETWKVGIPYPCMTGDIASTAGLTVHEPDGLAQFPDGDPSIRSHLLDGLRHRLKGDCERTSANEKHWVSEAI